MKRTILLILIIVMCWSLVACGSKQTVQSNNSDESMNSQSTKKSQESTTDDMSNDSIENQIQVIAENLSKWMDDENFLESPGFAVTDLDYNGRLEIICSSCQGTGYYSYNEIWEINKEFNGIDICGSEVEQYDSQADIMVQSTSVYYDSKNNNYYYIFDDFTKSSIYEYYENKRSFSLQEGKTIEMPLAYRITIYSDSASTITCNDASGNQISEEEYENIDQQVLNNYEKHQVSFGWIINQSESLKNMNVEKLCTTLKESYDLFSIDSITN